MKKIDPDRSDLLQIVRAAAAMLVVSRHARNALLVDYPQVPSPNAIEKVLYFITGLGHEAVIVFFVMSGYLVGGSILRSRTNFSWGQYAAARLARVWSVLIPALVLTGVCDYFLTSFFSHTLTSTGLLANRMLSMPLSHDLVTFFLNVFFMQGVLGPTYGTNGPLWSLAVEGWSYVLFPLFLLGLTGTGRSSARLVMVAAACLLLAVAPPRLQTLFCVWSAGALINVLRVPRAFLGRTAGIILLLIALASIVLSRSSLLAENHPLLSDLGVGLAFAAWIIHVHAGRCFCPPSALRRVGREVAGFSYSLYATQLPVLTLIVAVFSPARLPSGLGAWVWLILLISLLLCVAKGFWWLFERKAEAWRAALRVLLVRRGAEIAS